MKIGIISDLHDNIPYLESFLLYCKKEKLESLLLCGDIGNIDTLKQISVSFSGQIYFVFGNADTFYAEEIPSNIINLGESGIISDICGLKIGLCHEPYKIPELLKEKPYIIFHGHTHIPWIKQEGETMIVNSGTLGGWRNPSTFAVWDTSLPAPELIRTDEIQA